jgi:hypothetical protein
MVNNMSDNAMYALMSMFYKSKVKTEILKPQHFLILNSDLL